MNSHTHRARLHTMKGIGAVYIDHALPADEGIAKARLLAVSIYVRLQLLGTRQVRWHRGMLLTYPNPAPRGYGTRGLLVGVYTLQTRLEWIEEDVAALLGEKS